MSFDSFYKGVIIINKDREKKLTHSEINWDEPYALDFKSAYKCFKSLSEGKETDVPIYDFVHSVRLENIIILLKLKKKRRS